MKRRKTFLLAETLIVVAAVLLRTSISPIEQVHAQTTVVSIKPSSVTREPGEIFTIDVNITDVINLYGYELKIYFRNDIVNATSAVRPPGHFMEPSDPMGQFIPKWEIKNDFNTTHGRIWIAFTLLAPEPAKSGSGIIAKITFKGLNVGTTPITLKDVKLADNTGAPIPHTAEDGVVVIKIEISEPTIAVSPESVSATHKGEIIPINITINTLDKRWKAVGFEFKLGFNGTILRALNVTEGPFLKAFGETYMVPPIIKQNYVHVGLLLLPHEDGVGNWTVFPEGNGTLATVFFNVTHGPPVSTVLELYDTKIADITATPPGVPHTTISGEYNFLTEKLIPIIVWTDPKTQETHTFTLETVSNSTINQIEFNQIYKYISFTATGPPNTTGFCNITIPRQLLYAKPDEWLVLVDGRSTTYNAASNATHTWIYFTYSLTTKYIHIFGLEVIPEFPIGMFLTMFLVISAAVVIITKRTMLKKHKASTAISWS